MASDEKYKDLAKKLKALADRGVGGEKTNAESMLNDLLKKHNISIDDISGEKITQYYFNIRPSERPLLKQIVKHCNLQLECYGEFPPDVIARNNLPGNYMVKCTASEFVEIEAKFVFYNKLYNEELKVFWYAFLQANNLLIINHNKSLTEDEWLAWMRINSLAGNITVGKFTPVNPILKLKEGRNDGK